MKTKRKLLALILMVALGATSVFAQTDEITIVGSTTVLPIAQITAEKFMDANPGVSISVGGGGSSVGAKSLLAGTCDIADSSRALKQEEIAAALAKGIQPKPHVVAMDGIAVIVNPSNSVSELSLEQIKAIYTGQINDWSELGGAKGVIVVVSRDSASGTFEAFNELALKNARVRPDALLQASNQAVAQTVVQTPGAIGYIGMGYLTNSVKAVDVDGVKASNETVLSKEYPISRPLYMYTNGDPKGSVKEYLDFVKGKEGQKLAEEQGFVGLQ
jgi:phosphate transport system substrate-binding protein